MEEPAWRIDDLARRSGASVDTIRYYQREGLLPQPRRQGRNKLYGPEHLSRLDRIRELQRRRFSLAAIRTLLDEDRVGLVEGIFGGSQAMQYSFDELLERSGVGRPLAERLQEVGLLRQPAEFGRDAYDAADLDMLHAVAELTRAGLPPEIVAEIGAIYADGVEAMQSQVLEVFQGTRGPRWAAEDLSALQTRTTEVAGSLLPLVTRIVGYVHQRTLQRLTLRAIKSSRATG